MLRQGRLIPRIILMLACLALQARAHVVSQLYAEWEDGPPWQLEILFDAGFADPETRNDPDTPAPKREWLVHLGEPAWSGLRHHAETYLRENLELRGHDGSPVTWRAEFPDFAAEPPDFPNLLNDGAYFRIRISGETDGPFTLSWRDGENPTLVIKLGSHEDGYLSVTPGGEVSLGDTAATGSLALSFRQGFLHVVPDGLDHVLFILGLFFYRRAWKPLLTQSLAFTAAHTITLGLAAAGVVVVSGNWVEPVIALSIAAVAVENLLPRKSQHPEQVRLAVVFGFGLIHGLGFAGALSSWLQPGEGFLGALLSANLGVEAAQAALLAAAWCLTLRWHETKAYRVTRIACCAGIAAIGLFWTLERVGLIG